MLTCQASADAISIAGKLQVHFLDAIQDCLRAALDQPQALTVDISAVSEVDMAGLQLLLSFLRTRQSLAPTGLRGAPPFLARAIALSGLDSHFAAFAI